MPFGVVVTLLKLRVTYATEAQVYSRYNGAIPLMPMRYVLLCILSLLTACQHYNRPAYTKIQQDGMVQITGHLQMTPSGLYLVTANGDYRLNTHIDVWSMDLTVSGYPMKTHDGIATVNVFDVKR